MVHERISALHRPVSVEATIDSYRRLGPKSYLLAFAARNVSRLLVQIDQVA